MTSSRLKPYHHSIGNLGGSHHGMWFKKKKRDRVYQPTIGEDIELKVAQDHKVKTDPNDNRKRRTLLMSKVANQSWGFTLQSYGIQKRGESDAMDITYVDYVEYGSPAYLAGMQSGDVILSMNGVSVETLEHGSLIQFVRTCPDSVRVVVLFEDCCRKVEHHLKLRKLKKLLAAKMFELKSLENIERDILEGRKDTQSLRSESKLSLSDDWFGINSEYLDVFPSTPAGGLSSGFSYGSLPRNFSMSDKKKRWSTPPLASDSESTCSMMSVSDDGTSISNDLAKQLRPSSVHNLSQFSSPISLNPRVDSRYTSLPPEVRRKNGGNKRPDRHVGNSMFYGEWLSESESATIPYGSASSISTLSRDSGIYQTWSAGMVKNNNNKKLRGSTRSIGNSLFYLDSENDQEEGDMDTSSSTLDASQSSLDMVLNNPSGVVEERARKNKKYTTTHSNVKSSTLKSNKRSVADDNATDSDVKSSTLKSSSSTLKSSKMCSNNNGEIDNSSCLHNINNNDCVNATCNKSLRKSILVKQESCSNRPASLPDLEQCLSNKSAEDEEVDNISYVSQARDSGFESPVFITEESSATEDNSVSDWMATDPCCDHIKRAMSVDNILTSTPIEHRNYGNNTKIRKDTVSASNTDKFKKSQKRGRNRLSGLFLNLNNPTQTSSASSNSQDLSQSMGDLAVSSTTDHLNKSTPRVSRSPSASSFIKPPFRIPSFKLSRSKIRSSLSRLRNRSSSYFFSSGSDDINKTESLDPQQQQQQQQQEKRNLSRNRSTDEVASPDDTGASLVRINGGVGDIAKGDQYSEQILNGNQSIMESDRSLLSEIEAYATLPRSRRSSLCNSASLSGGLSRQSSYSGVGSNMTDGKRALATECHLSDDNTSSLLTERQSGDESAGNGNCSKSVVFTEQEINTPVDNIVNDERADSGTVSDFSVDAKPCDSEIKNSVVKRKVKRQAPKPPQQSRTNSNISCDEDSSTNTEHISSDDCKLPNASVKTEVLLTNNKLVWSFVPAMKVAEAKSENKQQEVKNETETKSSECVDVDTDRQVDNETETSDSQHDNVDTVSLSAVTPDYNTSGLLEEVMDALNSSGSSFSSSQINRSDAAAVIDSASHNESESIPGIKSESGEKSSVRNEMEVVNCKKSEVGISNTSKCVKSKVNKTSKLESKSLVLSRENQDEKKNDLNQTQEKSVRNIYVNITPRTAEELQNTKLFKKMQKIRSNGAKISSDNSNVNSLYNSEFWKSDCDNRINNFKKEGSMSCSNLFFGSSYENIKKNVDENGEEHLLVRPGWKSPLSQRHANKKLVLLSSSPRGKSSSKVDLKSKHDYVNVLGFHGYGVGNAGGGGDSTVMKDNVCDVANKVKFFSRNMKDSVSDTESSPEISKEVNDKSMDSMDTVTSSGFSKTTKNLETDGQVKATSNKSIRVTVSKSENKTKVSEKTLKVTAVPSESTRQLKVTSIASKSGSPAKRMVIPRNRLKKIQSTSEGETEKLPDRGTVECPENVIKGSTRRGMGRGLGGYKRRFYTYEEIPPVGVELTVVNTQDSETYL